MVPLCCDLGFVQNSRGNKAAAKLGLNMKLRLKITPVSCQFHYSSLQPERTSMPNEFSNLILTDFFFELEEFGRNFGQVLQICARKICFLFSKFL